MDQSLSIVLPAFNAQERLAAQVHELLEVLPDIAAKFEVLIVDDGSTDQTDEIARELAREYPQLKAVRHSRPLGESAVVETGVKHTSGDVVLVHDGRDRLSMGEMRKLCRPARKQQPAMDEQTRRPNRQSESQGSAGLPEVRQPASPSDFRDHLRRLTGVR